MQTTTSTIDITIMALREICMRYFKGDVTGNVASNRDISVETIANGSTRYQYQRRALQSKREQIVSLRNVPLFKVEKQPFVITFYMKPLHRSEQLEQVLRDMKIFIKRYLPAVTIKYEEGIPYANHN